MDSEQPVACPNPWCNSHSDTDPEIKAAHQPILMPSPASHEWAVACPVCPLQTPWFDTEAEAIAAWNTRPSAKVDALVEALRRIRDIDPVLNSIGDARLIALAALAQMENG